MRQLFIGLMLMISITAQASDVDRLKQAGFPAQVEGLALKNQAVLNYLWADVYAAALYAPADLSARQAWDQQKALRLVLYYFRNIDRADVIKAASATLERQQANAGLNPEIARLHARFRDIRSGDRYALDFRPDRGLNLAINDQVVFSSSDDALARAYLGIWLASEALSDKLRDKLLD